MSNIQVFHMEKRVTITGGLNRHITRLQWVDGKLVVWVPNNANPEFTKNNVELISREITDSNGEKRTLSLQQAVNRRIEEAGIKPRKGQTRSLEIIFSGSRDVLGNLSRSEVLSWANDTVEWSRNTWGSENVVSASLHLDERTPHIHMVVVPIVKGQSRRTKKQKELDKERGIKRGAYKINQDKLRLCSNEVYTSPLLYYYHDQYALKVSNKYGLVRGLRAEPGSKKKHQTSEDYNRQLAAEAAEKQSLIAEIQSDYRQKSRKVQDLETKSSTLSGEITIKEGRVSELKGAIDQNVRILNLQKSEYDYRKGEIEDQKTSIDANAAKITEQENQLTYFEKQLGIYQEIGKSIEHRQEQLKALSSHGLKKLIEAIPDIIKKEVQVLVSRNWNGEVVSFEDYEDLVHGVPQKFVRIHMQIGDFKYEFGVQESDGHVWKDGKWCTYKGSTREVYMPELASYFRQELLPETKEFVLSMFKAEAPAKTVEDEVVWTCNSGINNCRIIRTPDGIYHLQKQDWDTSKTDEKGRYYVSVWRKTNTFTSFKELHRDDSYAYLKIQHGNGNIEYINQYGINLNSKQLNRLGIRSGFGMGI